MRSSAYDVIGVLTINTIQTPNYDAINNCPDLHDTTVRLKSGGRYQINFVIEKY